MTTESLATTIKSLFRSGAALAYFAAGRHRRANLGQVVILMYHRVLKDDDDYIPFVQPGMYVRRSTFDQQIKFLASNYEILSFADMLELAKGPRFSKSRQYCVITLDDGWLDNYECAFPILKRHRVPATIFLTTAYVGTNRSFWHEKLSRALYHVHARSCANSAPADTSLGVAPGPLHLLRQHASSGRFNDATKIDSIIEAMKPHSINQIEQAIDTWAGELGIPLQNLRTMLNWDEVEEMSHHGISFGAHTCEHSILTQIAEAQAAWEIQSSMQQLVQRNLNFVPVFCYPNGRYNDTIKSLVAEAGYSAAVTTRLGRESGGLRDPFALSRIGIHEDVSRTTPLFSFRLR